MFAGNSQVLASVIEERHVDLLLARLQHLLPFSVPLYRRIQYHQRHPNPSSARLFAAVTTKGPVAESRRLDLWLQDGHSNTEDIINSADDEPWIAAHMDMSNAGQTQVFLFASWEIKPSNSEPFTLTSTTQDIRQLLVACVFKYMWKNLVPQVPLSPSTEWLTLKETGKYLSIPYSRSKSIFGSIHESIWPYFPADSISRTDSNYCKYIFAPTNAAAAPSNDSPLSVRLPRGYTFGSMREQDLQMVLDRSPIPRTIRTLREAVNVALHVDCHTEPVGWGFLSKDASLSSVHIEPEHRGKGLGACVSQELLRRLSREFDSKAEDGWGHADVSANNIASRKVMEKLGGQVRWTVSWIEVELERAVQHIT